MTLIRAGQETMGLRVPPQWLATCVAHWNGVSRAEPHSEAYASQAVATGASLCLKSKRGEAFTALLIAERPAGAYPGAS